MRDHHPQITNGDICRRESSLQARELGSVQFWLTPKLDLFWVSSGFLNLGINHTCWGVVWGGCVGVVLCIVGYFLVSTH